MRNFTNRLIAILLLLVSSTLAQVPAIDAPKNRVVVMASETVIVSHPDSSNCRVPICLTIEHTNAETGAFTDTLEVILKSGSEEIGGFDIKIGVSDPDLVINDILPGNMIDSCRWEFFKARSSRRAGVEGNPIQLWSAVAMAEMVTDSSGDKCFGWPGEISLLKIVLSSAPGSLVRDKEVPVFFWWEDCSDNTLADRNGGKLYMSTEVVSLFGSVDTATAEGFPTGGGAIERCTTRSKLNPPERLIEFRNGGVKFELKLGQPSDSSIK